MKCNGAFFGVAAVRKMTDYFWLPLASLAGGMTPVLLPLLLLSGMVLVEPVEGVVVEGTVDEVEPGVLTVSSVFLLQPPSARAAAKASTTAEADLRVGAYISVSFSKIGAAECQPDINLAVSAPFTA